MLVNLHVKNLAIIDEVDVDFQKHLNILTGETGAGKSILVGSVNLALGARGTADLIRKGADYAMVELVFYIENPETRAELEKMDVFPEEGQIVISRKIMENRSVNKINGENVTLATIRKVAELCIDIHGQHEHQSLLLKNRHLQIVDDYVKEDAFSLLENISKNYREYKKISQELEEEQIPEEERLRQISFIQYEKNEIESAALLPGEEEELEEEYQRLGHAEAIALALGETYQMTDGNQGAAEWIGRALQQVASVTKYDGKVEELHQQLQEIEGLLSDFNRDVSTYMDDYVFDEERYHYVSERLDLIRGILNRYGGDYEGVNAYLEDLNQKLTHFEDYEEYRKKCEEQKAHFEKVLRKDCKELSSIRKKGAKELEQKISEALEDLNFADARFSIHFEDLLEFSERGMDDVEFLIATNPGEDLKPLVKIASGGELSRIMLAIKSVFADTDQIETLIFDEIDVGISGRTAQKVSEKMSVLGEKHQIICITHLAQIAAMADSHYVIEKCVKEQHTQTQIRPLSPDESVQELARIIGGAEITDNTLISAKEMKELANKTKKYTV